MATASHISSDVEHFTFSAFLYFMFHIVFVPDKDLRGRNVVLFQSTVVHETLNITTDTLKKPVWLGCITGSSH